MPVGGEPCAAAYKILILGESSVGKTSLLRALDGKPFNENLRSTIGLDFIKKTFEVDGALVQLSIWDTAGQERFRSLTRLQYRGVQGIVLVFDITDSATYQLLSFWIRNIQEEVLFSQNKYDVIPIIVVGNKADVPHKRLVSSRKVKQLCAREMAFMYIETSAKTGENVHMVFQQLALQITDICHPHLLKSYNPYLLKTPESRIPFQEATLEKPHKHTKEKRSSGAEEKKLQQREQSPEARKCLNFEMEPVQLKKKKSRRKICCCSIR